MFPEQANSTLKKLEDKNMLTTTTIDNTILMTALYINAFLLLLIFFLIIFLFSIYVWLTNANETKSIYLIEEKIANPTEKNNESDDKILNIKKKI